MKNQLSFRIVAICFSLSAASFATSCSKEDDPPAREQFLGSYSVIETCGSGNESYELIILTSGSGQNAVIVNNLYDYGESASATIDGNNITIPSQLLDGLTYHGNGSISGSTLTINYTIANGNGNSDNCNAICTRK